MKKFFALMAVLLLITGLCFAQTYGEEGEESEEGISYAGLPKPELIDVEISVNYPVHWTNSLHNQEFYYFNPDLMEEDKTATANTSIGIAVLFNFNRKIGLTLDGDFFFSTKLTGYAAPTSDSISLFGSNVHFGLVFFLYNTDFLRIPLMIGAHMFFYSDDMWMPGLGTQGTWLQRNDLQVGPGFSLGAQFHFNKNIYMFSRISMAIDIFRWHQLHYIDVVTTPGTPTEETRTDTEFVTSLMVKPVLGIGVKY